MRTVLGVVAILLCSCSSSSEFGSRSQQEARHVATIEKSLVPSDAPGTPPQSIEARLVHWNVPAVSVAVFGEGEVKWAKAWGVADSATKREVSTRTRFQAGSISKPITALALLRLVDDGRVALDADVNTLLRSWKLPPHDWSSLVAVTPATLISHNAGVSVRSFPGYPVGGPVPTLEQILDGAPPANTPPIRITAQPGAVFSYSGGGYVILQQALMDVMGMPFEPLMRELVLGPLGMTESTFAVLAVGSRSKTASGHDRDGHPTEGGAHVYPESAAAGLWATPSDLARFAMGIQGALNEQGGRRAIVSRRLALWMISPNGSPTQGMAFDLSASTFYHAGDTEGFYAAVVASRDARMGIAVMTNGSQGGHIINEVISAVSKEYRWDN